ncbi:MAG: hypothetical protein R3A44_44260 [Caldilineaceae bacterium]
MNGISWKRKGFESKALENLIAQHGIERAVVTGPWMMHGQRWRYWANATLKRASHMRKRDAGQQPCWIYFTL